MPPIFVEDTAGGGPGPPGPPGGSSVLEWGADIVLGLPLALRFYLFPGYGFLAPGGLGIGAAPQYRVPRAGTLRNMRVRARGVGLPGAVTYALIVNGAASGLAVAMSNAAADGSELVTPIPVLAGDLLAIECSRPLLTFAPQAGIVASLELV